MRISAIKGANFKGPDFEYPLSGCDLFVGPNAIGKSRIREIADFAMRGKIAGAKVDRPDLIFRAYATDKDQLIKAQVRIVNGESEDPLTRFIGPDKAGKIGQAVKFKGKQYGANAAKGLIEKEFNPCIEAIDFDEFARLSDDADKKNTKTRYLLGLAGEPEGINRNMVYFRLAKPLRDKCRLCKNCSHYTAYSKDSDPPDDPHEELQWPDTAYGTCNIDCDETEGASFGCEKWDGPSGLVDGLAILNELFEPWTSEMGVSAGLIELREQIQVMLNSTYAEARDAAKVEEGLAEMENSVKKLAGDVVTAKRNLEAAQKREKELIESKSNANAAIEARSTWEKNKGKKEAALNQAKELFERQRDSIAATGYAKQIKEKQSQLHTSGEFSQLREELADIESKLPDLESEKSLAEGKVEAIKKTIEAYEKLIGIVKEGYPTCPLVPELKVECPAEWDDKLVEISTSLDTAKDELKVAKNESAEGTAAFNEAKDESDRITKLITDLENENKKIQGLIDAEHERRGGATEVLLIYKKGVTDAQRELKDHIDSEPHTEGIADVGKIQDELTGTETRIKTLKDDYEAKVQEKGRKVAAIEAERKRLMATERVEHLKVLKDEIGKILTEALNKTLGPVESLINECLPDNYRIAIGVNEGNPFGAIKDGEYRELSSLSGAEQSFIVTAVATALMNLKGTRLRVLMCELGELDRDQVIILTTVMARAVEKGYLDNFIGCKALADSEGPYPDIPGAEIWGLQRVVA